MSQDDAELRDLDLMLGNCCRRLLRHPRPHNGTLYRWSSLLVSLTGHSTTPSQQSLKGL